MRLATRLAPVVLLALGGCYWPVPHDEHAWPAIVGTLQQDDGRPAGGWQVSVTTNSGCREPRAKTRADANGRFAFTAATLRRRHLILPPVERFANHFDVCVGSADSTMRIAYRGRVPIAAEVPVLPDTLACALLRTGPTVATSCVGDATDSTRHPGGQWTDGTRTGRYQILVDQGTGRRDRPRVFVLWLLDPPPVAAADAPPVVVASTAVPLIDRLLYLDGVRLIDREGEPDCAAFSSTGAPPWYQLRSPRQRTVYELGPPGQVREVADCR